jgi:hypothetical protein
MIPIVSAQSRSRLCALALMPAPPHPTRHIFPRDHPLDRNPSHIVHLALDI